MGVKRLFVKIQQNMYDMWHVVSVEAEQEYNDRRNEFDYVIVCNKTAVSRDVREMRFVYENKAERDAELAKIEKAMRSSERFHFLGEPGDDFDEEEEVPTPDNDI